MAKAKKIETTTTETGVEISCLATDNTISAEVSNYSPEIQRQLCVHGLKQKLIDAAAGADPEHVFTAISAVNDALLAGTWTQRRESSGPRESMLAQALAEVANVAVEVAVAKLATLSDEEVASIRKMPAIKKTINQIKLKKLEAALAAEDEGDVQDVDFTALVNS